MPADSFGAAGPLTAGGDTYRIFRVNTIRRGGPAPVRLKVLLENLLRHEDGRLVTAAQIQALAGWKPAADTVGRDRRSPRRGCCCRISPGCPAWSTWPRCATRWPTLGGDPPRINPLRPAELVIDHSVIADVFGRRDAP